MLESAKLRAQHAHVPYVLYVPTRPTCPMCSTCPTCPCAQVYFTYRKIKNICFNEIKWRFVHWCFQGCWILIWTLIKTSFFKSVPKISNFSMLMVKTTLINAKSQNNTYKTINDMLKVYIKRPLALVRCKTKGQYWR